MAIRNADEQLESMFNQMEDQLMTIETELEGKETEMKELNDDLQELNIKLDEINSTLEQKNGQHKNMTKLAEDIRNYYDQLVQNSKLLQNFITKQNIPFRNKE